MSDNNRLTNTRMVLRAEWAAIRRRHPNLDSTEFADITAFTVPLLVRAVAVLAVGAVPLLVIRGSAEEDAVLAPLISSLALTVVCTAVVAWLLSIVVSGLVVMVLYRTRPRSTSRLVVSTLDASFRRISDGASEMTLLALVAGLLSLAIGLPSRRPDEASNSVLDDLLAAQIGVLLAVLGFAFIAESIRSAADIVDDQSLMLAWPWALIVACLSWVMATTVGPFEITRMLTILLNDWLPAMVGDVPRAEVIADVVPPGARWWAALGPLPVIGVIWVLTAWHSDGFMRAREFLAGEDAIPDTRLD
ncbi:hypothetical protein [Mycolicibacterium fallax]|uniref:Uncharacterized protein n=1 Tax=Mycolicibacterium fallax TaxID=1793 RepID=A0A1X1RDQ9_MYCFA|nr:hypothetical protein [Mycolicibacterium fallax]ORV03621.1 hypothetical protein AWC04_09775 [Mycolicibacterium fallax]BBY99408.1 hypothetical protein MFAL_28750 [Mycolicibacterium fallax]